MVSHRAGHRSTDLFLGAGVKSNFKHLTEELLRSPEIKRNCEEPLGNDEFIMEQRL